MIAHDHMRVAAYRKELHCYSTYFLQMAQRLFVAFVQCCAEGGSSYSTQLFEIEFPVSPPVPYLTDVLGYRGFVSLANIVACLLGTRFCTILHNLVSSCGSLSPQRRDCPQTVTHDPESARQYAHNWARLNTIERN